MAAVQLGAQARVLDLLQEAAVARAGAGTEELVEVALRALLEVEVVHAQRPCPAGRITSSLTTTCAGRVTIHKMASATSSAVSQCGTCLAILLRVSVKPVILS